MRTIDRIIDYVRTLPGLSLVEQQVIIARLDKEPSSEEFAAARELLDKSAPDAWIDHHKPS